MRPTSNSTGAGPPIEDLDVLVVANDYRHFTKRQVDLLAERVDSVHVLVKYNRLADVAKYVPLDSLNHHCASGRIDRTDQPDNVTVVPTPLLYLPIDAHYQRLGDKHVRHVERVLDSVDVEFDLVHAHFTTTPGYVAAHLAETRDVSAVLTVHENEDWLTELHESGRDDVHTAWRGVDTIIRVNRKDVALLEQYNDDVRNVPNGYSRNEFPLLDPEAAREDLGVPQDQDLVVGLGGLIERKRFGDLIDAIERLRPERPDARCVIAGRGPEQSALEQRVSEAGLEDQVSILGYVEQEELVRWLTAADVFVLPSESEGNPTVMFEALGCGTPYVGTNVGGVEEIVTDDTYGLLCEPGDVDRLAEIIDDGLDREWDREAILDHAEQYTWTHVVDELVDVYRDVLADPPTAVTN